MRFVLAVVAIAALSLATTDARAQVNSGCLATQQPINWTLPSTPGTPNWAMNLTGRDGNPGTGTVPFSVTFWRRPECPTQLLATFVSATAIAIGGRFTAFQSGYSNGFNYMVVNDPTVYAGNSFGLTFTSNPIQISGVLDEISPDIDMSQPMTIDWTNPFTGVITQVQIAAAESATPPPFAIGPGITGNWYDPAESGHGFGIEVLPGNQMLAEWYVFGPNGGRDWIVGVGPITGNTAVLTAFQSAGNGGRFPPNFNAAQVQAQPWGTITLSFTDCNNGTASWQPTAPGYTAGSIPIQRLTMPAGLTCP